MDLVKQKGIVINALAKLFISWGCFAKVSTSPEKLMVESLNGTLWTVSFKLENRELRTDMYKEVRITLTGSKTDSFPVRLTTHPLQPWEDLAATLLRELNSAEAQMGQLPLI